MMNLRIALEHDHEFRGDEVEEIEYPFDEIETAELAVMEGFNFCVSPVTAAMESVRPYSRRARSVATEGIALEEQGAGFWALVAVAIAAALALIWKMIGWFTGESYGSGGGGGGGGGGPSGGAIAKVEKKLVAAKPRAEAVRPHVKTVLKYAV